MRKAAYICPVLICLLIAGCSTARMVSTGTDIKEEPSKVIKVGVTTREEIIRAFGEPSSITPRDGVEEFVYETRKTEIPTYASGLIVNEAGKSVTLKRLEIVIQKGIVQSYKFEAKEE